MVHSQRVSDGARRRRRFRVDTPSDAGQFTRCGVSNPEADQSPRPNGTDTCRMHGVQHQLTCSICQSSMVRPPGVQRETPLLFRTSWWNFPANASAMNHHCFSRASSATGWPPFSPGAPGLLVLLASLAPLQAQRGALDLSFDPGGGVDGLVHVMKILDDGKILVGGAFTTYSDLPGSSRIARLQKGGAIDTSFAHSAIYSTEGFGAVRTIAVQEDGKILAGGRLALVEADYSQPSFVRLQGASDLLLHRPSLIGGDFQVSIPTTERGRRYFLEFTESLSEPAWRRVREIAGTGAPITLTDADRRSTQRFYRLRWESSEPE
ncbi:MAG: delta-60 repeat domain-containing protein [Verrucomicrobia bacterium]|nr:delta-60 repeat domain-containing protein [Verrucomicrobiota bacterium]